MLICSAMARGMVDLDADRALHLAARDASDRSTSRRARVDQIPILRYLVVGAGIASEGGAGAARAKKPLNQPNHMEHSQ
jgi:hypothetical protein